MARTRPIGGAVHPGADEIFQGDYIPDDEKSISPEQALWLAVIGRAYLDAFESSDFFLVQSERKNSDPAILRAEARRWLVLDYGGWREDRETVCDLAGIDADLIRDAARRRLKVTRADKAMELDRAFVKLVACSESMDKTALDEALAALDDLESEAA